MRRWLPLSVVVAAFVVSRILFYRAGVRFDAGALGYLWQLLDPAELRAHPWESAYYLHTNPPAFNLYVGLVLKWFPASSTQVFHLTYLAGGLVMALCLYSLAVRLRVMPWLAALVAVLFTISPSAICYENWLIYDHPIAVCLLVAAVALHAFVRRGGWGAGALMGLALALCPLIRSAYHLVWLLAAIGIVLLFAPSRRRRTLIVTALPLLLVIGVNLKNWLLFGFFGTSSWTGQNLIQLTVHSLDEGERERLISEGVLSPIAGFRKAFLGIDQYAPYLPPPEVTGIAVLDAPYKSTGAVNLNHKSYLRVGELCMHDFKVAIRLHPEAYLRALATTWMLFFESPTTTRFVIKNRSRIEGWNHLYNRYLYGEFTSLTTPQKTITPSTHIGYATDWSTKPYFLVAGLPLAFLYGLVRFFRAWRRRDPVETTTLGFIVMLLLYAALVHNCVALGDNHRYRFGTDAFFLTLLAMLGAELLRSAARRWRVLRS